MTPWSTPKKNERLYRYYYLPAPDNKEHAGASELPRLPAARRDDHCVDQEPHDALLLGRAVAR
ncbi:MAG: hypothetical protein M3461_10355 [Pseudomonadota bacterium]|nr:hypothetical protein [Pseudomonadota bacterium]